MSFAQPVWPRFLPTTTVLAFARVGPIGRLRHAPGTWGSLAGLMYHLVFFHEMDAITAALLTLPGLWLAVVMCGEAEFRLGRRDPGEVVLDEFTVIPLCFLGWPTMAGVLPTWAEPWSVLVAGFAVFRLFDILKPFGIKKLQDLPGGWGVVADDVAAALATCATLHGAAWAWTHFAA